MKKHSKEHILGCLEHVAGALKKSPTMEEYKHYREKNPKLELTHHKTIAYHSNGWNSAKREIGLEVYTEYNELYSEEYIINCLKCVADELGKSPSIKEYYQFKKNIEDKKKLPSFNTISERCGSWNKAKEKAGLKVYQKGIEPLYEKEHLYGCLEHVAGALKKSPTIEEYEKYKDENPDLNLPSRSIMIDYGWNELKKEIGLEVFSNFKRVYKKFDDHELNTYLDKILKKFNGLPKEKEYREYRLNCEEELPQWKDLVDFWIKEQNNKNMWIANFCGDKAYAIDSLEYVMEEKGNFPTKEEYIKFQKENQKLDLTKTKKIEEIFGSWENAKKEL